MESNTALRLAEELLDEVVEWVQSGDLLEGFESAADFPVYMYDDGRIPIAITNARAWHEATDARNADTVYVTLTDVLKEVQGAFFLVHQFGGREFRDLRDNKGELIRRQVVESDPVATLARKLHESKPNNLDMTRAECADYLRGEVVDNLLSVIDARILSLTKRYALTEAIFEAYKLGLFPFGWDWESLWCLNPKNLDSPGPIVRADEPRE